MSALDRYIRHPVAGTSGATAIIDANRPLGAGRFQLVLAGNTAWLSKQNALRTLASHPGVGSFYRQATDASTAAPTPGNIPWNYRTKDGAVTICLGTHYVWRYPENGRWPKLTCSFRWMVEGGYTLGAALIVVPGRRRPTEGPGRYDNGTTTSASFARKRLSLSLEDADLERVDHRPVGGTSTTPPTEGGQLALFTAYLGAVNSSNTNTAGQLAYIRAVSLFLEAPG